MYGWPDRGSTCTIKGNLFLVFTFKSAGSPAHLFGSQNGVSIYDVVPKKICIALVGTLPSFFFTEIDFFPYTRTSLRYKAQSGFMSLQVKTEVRTHISRAFLIREFSL